ncbi:HAD family hydrolase [Streptomyces phaeochromogenes]|uniref:HAD family hydrolase n=1 Tax=Streptomyces phaeochromogenes TaxID=1923 RepID=UPI00340DB033
MSRIFTRPHLVWGWTGTLTDDTDRYVQALNIALRPLGARQVGLDTFRRQFTTSSSALFAAILGRTLTPRERQQASIAFETHLAHRPPVQLRPGTEQLLARLIRSGCTHSALSLSGNHVVTQQISDLGIAPFFIRTEGLSDASAKPKAHPLANHIRVLRPDIGDRPIVVIGDDADDIRAAVANHVHPVPFAGGRTRPGILSQFGLPVAGTLAQAAALAVAYAHTARINSWPTSNGGAYSGGTEWARNGLPDEH